MGKPTKTTSAGIARKARWAGNMVIDALIAVAFLVGALLIGAVIVWVLNGDDDEF